MGITNEEIIEKYELEGDGDLGIDVDQALDEARADAERKQLDKILHILEDTEKRVNSANKNYKRGFFDGIHNAKAKIKELIE